MFKRFIMLTLACGITHCMAGSMPVPREVAPSTNDTQPTVVVEAYLLESTQGYFDAVALALACSETLPDTPLWIESPELETAFITLTSKLMNEEYTSEQCYNEIAPLIAEYALSTSL